MLKQALKKAKVRLTKKEKSEIREAVINENGKEILNPESLVIRLEGDYPESIGDIVKRLTRSEQNQLRIQARKDAIDRMAGKKPLDLVSEENFDDTPQSLYQHLDAEITAADEYAQLPETPSVENPQEGEPEEIPEKTEPEDKTGS